MNKKLYSMAGISCLLCGTLLFMGQSCRVPVADPELKNIYDNMISIPGGTFEMGCSDDSGYVCLTYTEYLEGLCDCWTDTVAHRVTISSFKMSAYEVTHDQWETVMGYNPSGFSGCSDCPIDDVSWNEVQDFIDELNGLTGKQYRLPTEAEWEYAARAGTTTKWYCGDDESCLDDIAWNMGNSNEQTHPVGQKEPNALGLYDMSGNVYEWVQDWYGEDYYSVSPSTDPQGPDSGFARAKRGGGWRYNGTYCRSFNRGGSTPSYHYNYLGFRLALD